MEEITQSGSLEQLLMNKSDKRIILKQIGNIDNI
jgi:hypothetical protein